MQGVDSPGSTDLDVFDTRLVGLIKPGQPGEPLQGEGVAGHRRAQRRGRAGAAGLHRDQALPPGLAITSVETITGVAAGPVATYRVTVTAQNLPGPQAF